MLHDAFISVRYPISSTWISRGASELQKTMKSLEKGRWSSLSRQATRATSRTSTSQSEGAFDFFEQLSTVVKMLQNMSKHEKRLLPSGFSLYLSQNYLKVKCTKSCILSANQFFDVEGITTTWHGFLLEVRSRCLFFGHFGFSLSLSPCLWCPLPWCPLPQLCPLLLGRVGCVVNVGRLRKQPQWPKPPKVPRHRTALHWHYPVLPYSYGPVEWHCWWRESG